MHIITLLLTFVTIGQQICFAYYQGFSDRLTQESYISPEMQWDVLYFLGAQELTLEGATGTVLGIQPIDVMLPLVYKKLQNPMTPTDKESIKIALQAMLEATDIAIFVAAIEAAYKDQKFLLYQSVDTNITAGLNLQKRDIQAALAKVNTTFVPGEASSSWSISSFLPWSISSNGSSNAPVNKNSTLQVPLANVIKIPAELMPTIIDKNSYKNMTDPKEAANLLFKQCFIAQQHHLYEDKESDRLRMSSEQLRGSRQQTNAFRTQQIKISLQSPISATNYIFNNFPNIDQICEIAKNSVARVQPRSKVQDPITFEHLQAHKLLLHIRQANQTALYIANPKSSYNVTSILPNAVRSYLGGIVGQLLQYDAQLAVLCKDPKYGATTEDTYQDEQWAMITKIAAGIVITAAVVGTAAALAPVGTAGAIAKGATSFVPTSWWSGSSSDTTKNISQNSGIVPPGTIQASPTLAQQAWKAGEIAAGYAQSAGKTVGEYGETAAKIGGVLTLATSAIQYADTHGYAPLKDIDPNARYYVDLANTGAAGLSVVGGAGQAVGFATGAITGAATAGGTMLTSTPSLMGVINAVDATSKINRSVDFAKKSTENALTVGVTSLGAAAQLAGLANAPTTQNNPPAQNRNPRNPAQQGPVQQAPTTQITPQKLADGFAKMIAAAAQQGTDASEKITETSIKLLTDGKANPIDLLNVLQYVQANSAATDPNLANNLGQFIEILSAELSKVQ